MTLTLKNTTGLDRHSYLDEATIKIDINRDKAYGCSITNIPYPKSPPHKFANNVAMMMLQFMVLEHYNSGVDISSQGYLDGISAALQTLHDTV
jgi:hypothetical protein